VWKDEREILSGGDGGGGIGLGGARKRMGRGKIGEKRGGGEA